MNRFLLFLFVGVFWSCSSARKAPEMTSAVAVGNHMNYLASDELMGRDTGSEGIELAARYSERLFSENKISPFFKTFRDTLSNIDVAAFNIVGVKEGSDPRLKEEYIIIGAHYDHIGVVDPVDGDAIANGANDNAAGSTTVLELARYFGLSKPQKRSLIFALFSAEEKGLLGAFHLAKKLKSQGVQVYTVLNFEMTGVPMTDKDYLVYMTGYNKSNLAEISNSYAGKKLVGFLPKASEFQLFKRSDNYAFFEEMGVPAHTFSSFDFTNFEHYHQVGDEADMMDFQHMTRVINSMIPVIEGIANAAEQEIELRDE